MWDNVSKVWLGQVQQASGVGFKRSELLRARDENAENFFSFPDLELIFHGDDFIPQKYV